MPSPGKLLALQALELPQTVTALRGLLCITTYFSKYVPNYAEAAEILMSKLQVGQGWKAGVREQDFVGGTLQKSFRGS